MSDNDREPAPEGGPEALPDRVQTRDSGAYHYGVQKQNTRTGRWEMVGASPMSSADDARETLADWRRLLPDTPTRLVRRPFPQWEPVPDDALVSGPVGYDPDSDFDRNQWCHPSARVCGTCPVCTTDDADTSDDSS